MRLGAFVMAMACAVCLCADTAFGAAFGLRGGYGTSPDQGVIGVQGQLGGKRLKAFGLVPSADFGFGDSMTTICGNLDFILSFGLPGSESSLYAGAGPTVTYWDHDSSAVSNDTEIGLSLVGGARFGMGEKHAYSAEVRFGVGDIPEFRILVGILFGARKGAVKQ